MFLDEFPWLYREFALNFLFEFPSKFWILVKGFSMLRKRLHILQKRPPNLICGACLDFEFFSEKTKFKFMMGISQTPFDSMYIHIFPRYFSNNIHNIFESTGDWISFALDFLSFLPKWYKIKGEYPLILILIFLVVFFSKVNHLKQSSFI